MDSRKIFYKYWFANFHVGSYSIYSSNSEESILLYVCEYIRRLITPSLMLLNTLVIHFKVKSASYMSTLIQYSRKLMTTEIEKSKQRNPNDKIGSSRIYFYKHDNILKYED